MQRCISRNTLSSVVRSPPLRPSPSPFPRRLLCTPSLAALAITLTLTLTIANDNDNTIANDGLLQFAIS